MPIHPLWIVGILVVVLIIFGPGRLPELGAGLGKAMREFRKATTEITNDVTSAAQSKPEPAASTSTSDKSSTPETKPTGN